MIPVVTPEEMRAIDASAPVPEAVLVERAGAAVARAAVTMLGGTYGRRVVVLAGSGNNGADGRVAAARLAERGVRVHVVEVRRDSGPVVVPTCDLVIDAVLGTGFSGTYRAPEIPDVPVLAVDIPSGVDARTGAVSPLGQVLQAERTVTFAALKPGLLFGAGASLAGEVEVADIGLEVPSGTQRVDVLDDDSVRSRLPARARDAHKWSSAVLVVAGSPGMTGAAALAARGAQRAGAGMVRLGVPGEVLGGTEAVGVPVPPDHWANAVLAQLDRCGALVLGPGLGRSKATLTAVGQVLSRASVPVVLDGDGLAVLAAEPEPDRDPLRAALGSPASSPTTLPAGQRAVLEATARRVGVGATDPAAQRAADRALERARDVIGGRTPGSTILTPHDGEHRLVTGAAPTGDRIASARALAQGTGAIVLLKGPVTVIADPGGRVELVRSGDARLATAGTGDVLAGMIGALVARGMSTFEAASCAAHIHGAAALLGHREGFVAGDLPELVAAWLSGASR